MSPTMLIAVIAIAWLAWAWCAWRFMDNPRAGDPVAGLTWRFVRLYARVMHRIEVRGASNIPKTRDPGPLIVIANHTAGIDPVLLQAVCPFEIRWVMAADMRHPAGEPFWQWTRIIFVDRSGKDMAGIRDAIRHVQEGGVLGMFPEGGIERPANRLLPFQSGIGLIIKKTKAPVLPMVISDTPHAPTAWGSLLRRSRSRVTVLPMMRLDTLETTRIAPELQRIFVETTGWSVAEAEARPEPIRRPASS